MANFKFKAFIRNGNELVGSHLLKSSLILFLFLQFSQIAFAQQCAPISTLDCADVVVEESYTIEFNGAEGGLTDKNGLGTGFKMVDSPSSPLSTPSNPSVPGYEPSNLEISNGKLLITSTSGISAKNPATSPNTNSQVNALGVGLNVSQSIVVQTKLIEPSAGTGKYEQAGIWFGLDEDNYVKLDVISAGNGRSQIEMVKEVDGVSTNSDAVRSNEMALSSSVVTLKLYINLEENTLVAIYSIDGGSEVLLGELNLPASFKNGKAVGENTTASFAGIYTTNRNSSLPIVYAFDDFRIFPASNFTLTFAPDQLNFEVGQNSATSTQSAILSTNQGSPTLSLTKFPSSDWLILPASVTLGDLSFGVNTLDLAPGSYAATVIASAPGFIDAELNVNLIVNQVKTLSFIQASQNVELVPGSTQSIPETISTSDNNQVSISLTAANNDNQIPTWITVNGEQINNLSYSSGTGITFDYNTSGLTPGYYNAVLTASASGYPSSSIPLNLEVKDPSTTNVNKIELDPIADAFVRGGSFSSTNFGNGTSLQIKTSAAMEYSREAYLKFSLTSVSDITSAKLRIFGRNVDNATSILISAYGIENDAWTEADLNWYNKPASSTPILSSVGITNERKYYEFEVTEYVKAQALSDKTASFLIKDPVKSNTYLSFNSKENSLNPPQLVIETAEEQTDQTPPLVSFQLSGEAISQDIYVGQVDVNISASDEGGSGLQSVNYSLDNGPFESYNTTFTINLPGDHSLIARATDGEGNITLTEVLNFTIIEENAEGHSIVTLSPVADSFVRSGTYENTNYGSQGSLLIKSTNSSNFSRISFIKFSLNDLSFITGAKLRIYGKNLENQNIIPVSVIGLENDSWEEMNITWSNAPSSITPVLNTIDVSAEERYYEIDVTDFILAQFNIDQVASFKLQEFTNKNVQIGFASKERGINGPQLIITSGNGSDTKPPVVSIELDGVFQSTSAYKNKVDVIVNASDEGGSGLALLQYSINGGPFLDYTGPYTIDAPGTYTLKAKAVDGKGNSTLSDDRTFSIVEVEKSNNLLFVENLDKFPANDHLAFSLIQIPWSRDGVVYNANHDQVTLRIHNKGSHSLIISELNLSNSEAWKIEKLEGISYDPGSQLPLTIISGTFADVQLKFIALDQATRVKVLHETLTIISNDDKITNKVIYLHGLWQKQGEGKFEPYAQEMIDAFGLKSNVGFEKNDPDKGDLSKPKGDEILSSHFLRADPSKPVFIRQMGAYHGCCNATEKIVWNPKGTNTLNTVFTHIGLDGQTLLPRKSTAGAPAEGTFNPNGAFSLKIAGDWTDPSKNSGGLIGIRVWKAKDANGKIIPNAYIIANDYLGSSFTNYDYNDNMYYISNIRPEVGTAYHSILAANPSSLDFDEKEVNTTNSLQLNLMSLGQVYENGSKDPDIVVSSVELVGENKSEFTINNPLKTTLIPQEATTMEVFFKPLSQGLKNAAVIIHYNNNQSPLRVPLYGIAKEQDVTVTAHFRINSGSSAEITINNKTWAADNQYALNNLEPYRNGSLTEILATDEDEIYLIEQSSNGDKRPFRYEIPVENGDYVVRLHFAEIYWGAPGSGLAGGAGSRVFSVSLENTLRLANLDVAQEVGPATAMVKDLPVTVSDGKLNINFTASTNRPMVCAVEVYSFDPNTANVSASNLRTALESNDLISSESRTINIFPNPAQSRFNIDFSAEYKGNTTVAIFDQYGKIVRTSTSIIPEGGASIEYDLTEHHLKTGIYFLKIQSESGHNDVLKLIITN